MKSFILAVQRPILGLLVLGISFVSSVAYAEGCTPIASVPISITVPGTYCLTDDLVFSGYGIAIDIQADDVAVDFKGHELKGAAIGVAGGTKANIIVRNGRITNTRTGIIVGTDSIVENMIITNISAQGILVGNGNNSLIRNNVITNVVALADNSVTGILVQSCTQGARAVRVLNNVISGVKRFSGGTKVAVAIESKACSGVIRGNSINTELNIDYGISISYAGAHLIVDNIFSGTRNKDIFCGYFSGTVKYKDNLSDSPYGGQYDCQYGTDLGGNI